MKEERSQHRLNRMHKGQSFLEVAITLPVLLILLSGLLEFGLLLNEYMNLLDGPREGARQADSFDPGDPSSLPFPSTCFYNNVEAIAAGRPASSCGGAVTGAIDPVSLNPATDDVLVSVYQVDCSGMSVMQMGSTHSWAEDIYGHARNGTSRFTGASLAGIINVSSDTSRHGSGIILVELFYKYKEALALPWLTVFLGDTIPVYSYTIMPLNIAAPTCS